MPISVFLAERKKISGHSKSPRRLDNLDQIQMSTIWYDNRWLECPIYDIAPVKKEVAVVGRKCHTQRELGRGNLGLGRQSKWPRDWLVPFPKRFYGGLE